MRIREICSKHDVLLLADDVITGFGRTGRWFGLDHYGIEHDIMQFAKGITSGYVPVWTAAVVDTLRVVVPEPTTAAGLNDALAPDGRPVMLKFTAPVKPFCGATVAV